MGAIVTPAQALLAVVPDDSHLEIEAMVSNRDIGFVHSGQAAEIKSDTFNFTRYGLLHGRVLSLLQMPLRGIVGKTSSELPAARPRVDSKSWQPA